MKNESSFRKRNLKKIIIIATFFVILIPTLLLITSILVAKPPTLEITSFNPESIMPNQDFQISVKIYDPFSLNQGIKEVIAQIKYPNDTTINITMTFNDGIYEAVVSKPIPGSYLITLIATDNECYTTQKTVNLEKVGLNQSEREYFTSLGVSADFIDNDENWKCFLYLEEEKVLSLSQLWDKNSSLCRLLIRSVSEQAALYHDGFPMCQNFINLGELGEQETYEHMYRACIVVNRIAQMSLSELSIDIIANTIIYGNRTQDFNLLDNITELNQYLSFIEKHPDCLNFIDDGYVPYEYTVTSLFGENSTLYLYNYTSISEQNAKFLWFYLLNNYEETTIVKYLDFFKAAVSVYKDFFMTTVSTQEDRIPLTLNEKVTLCKSYLILEEEECHQLKRLLDLYITWNEAGELFVDLSSLEPIKQSSIDSDSTFSYLTSLIGHSVTHLTEYYYSFEELKEFCVKYGGSLAGFTYHVDAETPPYMLDIPIADLYASTGIYSELPNNSTGFTRFIGFSYWIDELEFRHYEMFNWMQNTTIAGPIQNSVQSIFDQYNVDFEPWDEKVFLAIELSRNFHWDFGCANVAAQGRTDLCSLGFACGSASFHPIIGASVNNHVSLAPWVSKSFIISQEKNGGALNFQNYIPWGGAISLEYFNVDGANQSEWKDITVGSFLDYKVVYERPE